MWYLPQDERTDRPVLGYVRGTEGALMVDAGMGPGHVADFFEGIRKHVLPSPDRVVLTHWHWDHVLGLDDLSRCGLKAYGRGETDRELEGLRGKDWSDSGLDAMVRAGDLPAFSRDCIRREIPEAAQRKIGGLDILVGDERSLDLGGLEVSLVPLDSPHTDDSLAVVVPEYGVTFLGDAIYGRRYRGVYGYRVEQFIAMVHRLLGFGTDWYVISHMDPLSRQGLEELLLPMAEMAEFVGDRGDAEGCAEEYAGKLGRGLTEDEVQTLGFFTQVNALEL
ncbi:hypothetical protein DC28_01045 [Spirochaeta lutea]|uniref:Metallo-beta-lactamase domain-containing protein n=1 Tax=Spirochaeta lutea TaxID=1480694 RepID=A0A098R2G7_9SPIO|nr:hypothetical protein DC28_01045 [Spirochaeta lutea]